jgi:hypothetical protein
MQLSAANLLIASQQIARGTAKAAPEAAAQFASALAKENGALASGFAPMDFKQTAMPAKPAAAPSPQAPSAGYGAGMRLGANLDIKV